MASDVEVCNLALVELGDYTISSLTEDTEVARKCNALFSHLRKKAIRRHPWNFASAQATLAQLVETPDFGLLYAYQLPSDCMRVLGMEKSYMKYKIRGRKLYTDEATCKILYLKDIPDTTQWDPAFVVAFSKYLGSELAWSLTNSRTLKADLRAEYLDEAREATGVDAQEETPDELEADDWINSRG